MAQGRRATITAVTLRQMLADNKLADLPLAQCKWLAEGINRLAAQLDTTDAEAAKATEAARAAKAARAAQAAKLALAAKDAKAANDAPAAKAVKDAQALLAAQAVEPTLAALALLAALTTMPNPGGDPELERLDAVLRQTLISWQERLDPPALTPPRTNWHGPADIFAQAYTLAVEASGGAPLKLSVYSPTVRFVAAALTRLGFQTTITTQGIAKELQRCRDERRKAIFEVSTGWPEELTAEEKLALEQMQADDLALEDDLSRDKSATSS